jgi:hypothetical protein
VARFLFLPYRAGLFYLAAVCGTDTIQDRIGESIAFLPASHARLAEEEHCQD